MKSTITSFVSAVSLLGIAFGLVAPDGALALKREDILNNYVNCNFGCDDTQTACNRGCCIIFGRICGGGCITSCQSATDTCKSNCASSMIGAPTDGAFFDTATIARNGRTIAIGGPFFCPDGATTDLEVTLTQAGVGAVAKGGTQFQCPTGGDTSFALDLTTVGKSAFRSLSTAQACGTARIHTASQSIDSFQWCREITVLSEGVELDPEN